MEIDGHVLIDNSRYCTPGAQHGTEQLADFEEGGGEIRRGEDRKMEQCDKQTMRYVNRQTNRQIGNFQKEGKKRIGQKNRIGKKVMRNLVG